MDEGAAREDGAAPAAARGGDPQKSPSSPSMYLMKPELKDRFKPQTVKELIHTVLNDELRGKTYSADEAPKWADHIAKTLRNKMKELSLRQYKYMVQVLLGEQRGAGVKTGMRCLWDADTDNYANDVFLSDTMFCMAVVFAVYFY
ncbi:dynein light chain Tctex-type protein 2B-like [Bacillus rossius redtenbacheri]|uniref:dynein light chain Tctex-type protein 2B-like n=1 Tax=Bacillus rossius redtenbacheri TaxID=93214 RepID=UPI002FDC828A